MFCPSVREPLLLLSSCIQVEAWKPSCNSRGILLRIFSWKMHCAKNLNSFIFAAVKVPDRKIFKSQTGAPVQKSQWQISLVQVPDVERGWRRRHKSLTKQSSACLYPKSCGKLLCLFPAIGAIIFRKLDKTFLEADEPGCHMPHLLTVCHPSSYGVVCLWIKIRSHILKCQGFFKHCFCFQGSKQEMPSSVPQLVGTGISDMQQKPGLAHGKYRNIFLDLKSPNCLLLFCEDKYQNQ